MSKQRSSKSKTTQNKIEQQLSDVDIFGMGDLNWDVPKMIGIVILIAFIGITLIIPQFKKNDASSAKTQAVIIKSNREDAYTANGSEIRYSPTIKYTVNGKDYEVKALVSDTEPQKVGGTIEITYNPNDPSQINTTSRSSKKTTLLSVGFVLLLLLNLYRIGKRVFGKY